MCDEYIWLCHCCEENVIRVHYCKCYDTITDYNFDQTIVKMNGTRYLSKICI